MSVSVRVRAVSRVAEGGVGVGFAKPPVKTQGLSSGGPPVKRGHSHLRTKWLRQRAMVLAALFVGDNGLKSKTDSPLRGNGGPASELIKQLLCISEGTACLMADTRRGNLAALWLL